MQAEAIYLDHNATTVPCEAAIAAMGQALTSTWANPSSTHPAGQRSREALAQARAQVARMLNCKPAEVVFTSGATEANHMALQGAAGFNGRRRLLIGAAEHAGVQKLARHLAGRQAIAVDWLGLTPGGDVDLDQARTHITGDVALVSVMAANNETGVLMPTGELARMAHEHGALLHVDATQLIGKLPFDFARSGADLVSLSAHKFHGPKGVGALIVRQGINWPALFMGSQERGRRGGTENLPGILGMAAAAAQIALTPDGWLQRAASVARLRDQLEQGLLAAVPGTVIFGGDRPRLPNTTCLRFGRLHADVVLQRLDRLGVMASSGAACAASGHEPSHALLAMGVPRDEAQCAVRLSLSSQTTVAEVRSVLARLPAEIVPLLDTHASPPTHPAPHPPTGVPA